jgi:hypothetical protein
LHGKPGIITPYGEIIGDVRILASGQGRANTYIILHLF